MKVLSEHEWDEVERGHYVCLVCGATVTLVGQEKCEEKDDDGLDR